MTRSNESISPNLDDFDKSVPCSTPTKPALKLKQAINLAKRRCTRSIQPKYRPKPNAHQRQTNPHQISKKALSSGVSTYSFKLLNAKKGRLTLIIRALLLPLPSSPSPSTCLSMVYAVFGSKIMVNTHNRTMSMRQPMPRAFEENREVRPSEIDVER